MFQRLPVSVPLCHDRIDTRRATLLLKWVVGIVAISKSITLGLLTHKTALFQSVLLLLVQVLLGVLKCTYVHIVVGSVHSLPHTVVSVPFGYDPTVVVVELDIEELLSNF